MLTHAIFNIMNNIYHVIKDPVHGTMQFTSVENAWIKPFIDSPIFQRLRHIKQLGLGDIIFPGAVHTRFNHSLGCCYVASQIAHTIGLSDDQRQLVMIACLLHDIGHGPFSHAFEGIFQEKKIRHELWTPYFLAEFGDSSFFKLYNKINPKHKLTAEKFDEIANMIMHRTTKKNVLADIVSSQLDADRLDYLLRDNHFCGVKYGEFDFPWMLHCMTTIETNEGSRLGITHKGIGAVEHYLMARRLMTRNIYHSQKKLAIESLLVALLDSLAQSLEYESNFKAIQKTRLGQFLMAANRFNEQAERGKGQEAQTSFLKEHYENYKELCDYDVFALIKQLSVLCDDHPAIQMAARLQHRKMPKIVHLDPHRLEGIKSALQEFKRDNHKTIADWQIMLIQTPHRSYSEEDDPILVRNEHGVIKSVGDFSLMLNAISDRLEHVAFLAIDKMIVEEEKVQAWLNSIAKSQVVSSD